MALEHTDGAELVAVCGPSPAATPPSTGLPWCADVGELVSRPDVSVVGICSPNAMHARQVRLAIEAGKHVVVEKPPAATPGELRELATAAEDRGVILSVVSQQRFLPHPRHAAAILASGQLGRVLLGEVRLHWHRPQSYYDQASWRARDRQAGSLANQGWHATDLLTLLCGPAASIAGHVAALARDIAAEDTATATIRFRNSALGVLVTTTVAPMGEPSVIEVITDRARIRFDDALITRWEVPDGVPPPPPTGSSGGGGANDPTKIEYEPHRMQWREVIAAIDGGHQLSATAWDALATLELIDGVYRSSTTGTVVSLRTTGHAGTPAGPTQGLP